MPGQRGIAADIRGLCGRGEREGWRRDADSHRFGDSAARPGAGQGVGLVGRDAWS